MALIGQAVRIRPAYLDRYRALGFDADSAGVIVALIPPDRVRVDWGGDLGIVSGLLVTRLEVL